MISKWLGPLALLAVLVIGDQIRINRPGHKYRLTVEVETPEGIKSASGVMAVTPDRGYSRHGHTQTSGDALYVDLGGGKNLVALLAHIDNNLELDGINYVALRAYTAAAGGKRVSFNDMNRQTGTVPVTRAMVEPCNTSATKRALPTSVERLRRISCSWISICWRRSTTITSCSCSLIFCCTTAACNTEDLASDNDDTPQLTHQVECSPEAGIFDKGQLGADAEGLPAEFAVDDGVAEADGGLVGGAVAG